MIYPADAAQRAAAGPVGGDEYISFQVAGQWLGLPVEEVQEILFLQRISPVPLAPPEVAGLLNLRGQIVTAVDLRARLGLPARSGGDGKGMNVVVSHQGELFSVLVDTVGEVVRSGPHGVEPAPSTLDPRWRSCCTGVLRQDDSLLAVLDVDALLQLESSFEA